MIVDTLIKKGSEILKKENIISYKIDSELLLSKVLGRDRVCILINGEKDVSSKIKLNYLDLIMRRKRHEPISYITNNKEFWSLDFTVNKNVLIPRPDTEIIVENVLKKFKYRDNLNILDIGTGSGCVLLSILKELKKSHGIGIDKSSKAVNIARKNSKSLNLFRRTKFINCNVDNFNYGNYDVIVSNPPYINSYRVNSLSKEIKNYEPRLALDGGISGIETIKKVIFCAKKLLKNNGSLFIEIGNNQSNKVLSMLNKSGFMLVKKLKDYTNTTRCIISTKII